MPGRFLRPEHSPVAYHHPGPGRTSDGCPRHAGREPPGRGGGGRARDPRRAGHRPDADDRALPLRRRPDPDLDGARQGRDRPPHRREGARYRRPAGLDGLRAHQRHRRADRPPPRRAAFPARRLGRDLAGSRRVPHRRDHGEPGHPARARGQPGRRPVPDHARSRHHRDVRGRAAGRRTCPRSISGTRRPTARRSTA